MFRDAMRMRETRPQQPQVSPSDLLSERFPANSLIIAVFRQLVKNGNLLKSADVANVTENYLLADAAFQCQLIIDLPLPTAAGFRHRLPVDNLPLAQQVLVKAKLDYVCGKRPLDEKTELDIANGKVSADTFQEFESVCFFLCIPLFVLGNFFSFFLGKATWKDAGKA